MQISLGSLIKLFHRLKSSTRILVNRGHFLPEILYMYWISITFMKTYKWQLSLTFITNSGFLHNLRKIGLLMGNQDQAKKKPSLLLLKDFFK